MSFLKERKTIFINDLILSCRAMGRGIEDTMMNIISHEFIRQDLTFLELEYKKTPKNKPIFNFLKSSNLKSIDESIFNSKEPKDFPLPNSIKLNYYY